MATLVPTRSVVQVRTHSQKYFAKIDKGEQFPDAVSESANIFVSRRAEMGGKGLRPIASCVCTRSFGVVRPTHVSAFPRFCCHILNISPVISCRRWSLRCLPLTELPEPVRGRCRKIRYRVRRLPLRCFITDKAAAADPASTAAIWRWFVLPLCHGLVRKFIFGKYCSRADDILTA